MAANTRSRPKGELSYAAGARFVLYINKRAFAIHNQPLRAPWELEGLHE